MAKLFVQIRPRPVGSFSHIPDGQSSGIIVDTDLTETVTFLLPDVSAGVQPVVLYNQHGTSEVASVVVLGVSIDTDVPGDSDTDPVPADTDPAPTP